LREFIQRNLHATAEIEDLQAIAEELTGDDLSQFFTSWVTETTVPQLPANQRVRPAHIGTYALPRSSGETPNFADVGWPRSGAELEKGCLRVGLVARGHRLGDRDEPMLGEPLKAAFGGSISILRGGLGTPEYFVLPMFPPGSPLPSTNEARPAFRHPAPACSLQPPTVESDSALGEAQGDRLVVDIGGVGRAGEGQTDPGNHVTAKFRSHRGPFPTTSPLGPRTTEPVGSVNLSPNSSQRDGQTAPVKGTSPHRAYRHTCATTHAPLVVK
jgi:hypothetical protein